MMMKSKGFIFDLDGVIVDTARYHYLAWKKLANTLGFDISEEENENLKGLSRVKSLQIILKWGDISCSDNKFMQLMTEKNNDYLSYIATMTSEETLPGAQEIIRYILQKNQPVALGSASKNANAILKKIGLYHSFNAIVDGNEVSKTKPDPEVFITAARKINVPPENCIVFEDSIAGIQAANKAGMISIGIGDKKTLKHADYVFKNLARIDFSFIDKLIENESEIHPAR